MEQEVAGTEEGATETGVYLFMLMLQEENMRRRSERPTEEEVFNHQLWTLAHLLKLHGNLVEVKIESPLASVAAEIVDVEDNTAELHPSVGITVRITNVISPNPEGSQLGEADVRDQRQAEPRSESDLVTGLDPRD